MKVDIAIHVSMEAAFEMQEVDMMDEACEQFLTRFDWSAQEVGCSATLAHALQGAFCEMAANAAEHACSGAGALLGYYVRQGAAVFCVVDAGVGVLASLTTHPAYAHITRHRDALRTALQDGASRHGPRTRGLGFRQVFKSLADQRGHLRFRSGEACIAMQGHDDLEQYHPEQIPALAVPTRSSDSRSIGMRTRPPSAAFFTWKPALTGSIRYSTSRRPRRIASPRTTSSVQGAISPIAIESCPEASPFASSERPRRWWSGPATW